MLTSNRLGLRAMLLMGFLGCAKEHAVSETSDAAALLDTGAVGVDVGVSGTDSGFGSDAGLGEPDAGVCGGGAVGATCTTNEGCCSGACSFLGAGAYIYGECLAPVPDGSYCVENSWCLNHNCAGNRCGGDGSCAADDASGCKTDLDCCSGLCAIRDGSGVCGAKRGGGAECEASTWCLSGSCVDSACE